MVYDRTRMLGASPHAVALMLSRGVVEREEQDRTLRPRLMHLRPPHNKHGRIFGGARLARACMADAQAGRHLWPRRCGWHYQ